MHIQMWPKGTLLFKKQHIHTDWNPHSNILEEQQVLAHEILNEFSTGERLVVPPTLLTAILQEQQETKGWFLIPLCCHARQDSGLCLLPKLLITELCYSHRISTT